MMDECNLDSFTGWNFILVFLDSEFCPSHLTPLINKTGTYKKCAVDYAKEFYKCIKLRGEY